LAGNRGDCRSLIERASPSLGSCKKRSRFRDESVLPARYLETPYYFDNNLCFYFSSAFLLFEIIPFLVSWDSVQWRGRAASAFTEEYATASSSD